jgi:hypothetical protein
MYCRAGSRRREFVLVRAAAVDRMAEQWREDERPLQWVEVHHTTTPGGRARNMHARTHRIGNIARH